MIINRIPRNLKTKVTWTYASAELAAFDGYLL
jgi:hypothetical protein